MRNGGCNGFPAGLKRAEETAIYPPKQLSMLVGADRVRLLPEVTLPQGYVLRGYLPGDEDGWAAVLRLGGFTDWERDRIDTFLVGPERREGSRVVSLDGQIVAATFASRGNRPAGSGVLDFVVSHPDHRGKGLGRAVCTAVLRFLVDRGYAAVTLQTDDWRLPAISLYLSLGFVPQMTREDMPSRWEAVRHQIEGSRHERP